MPYIKDLVKRQMDEGCAPATVGELTYVIQQQMNLYLRARSELHFSDIAECLGALEAAKADLTARVLSNYESIKLRENGDVWDRSIMSQVTWWPTRAEMSE